MSVIKNFIFVCLFSLCLASNSFSKDLDILFKNLLTAENYQDAEIIEQVYGRVGIFIQRNKASLTN